MLWVKKYFSPQKIPSLKQIMKQKLLGKYHKLVGVWLLSLVLTMTLSLNYASGAKISEANNLITQEKQQINLKEGEVIVTGDEGKYTGKLLIKAPLKTAWSVLTDYDNFKNFLPNVVSSQVIESNGNKKVFDQVNMIQAFIFTKTIRFRIASTETYPQQIAFKMLEGDVKSLEGVWELKVISNQVLIEHQVNIDPGDAGERELFFMLYPDNLAANLEAFKLEIKRRS